MCAWLFIIEWSFLLLFLVIHTGCWLEYQKLVEIFYTPYQKINVVHKWSVILLGCASIIFMCFPQEEKFLLGIIAALFVIWIVSGFFSKERSVKFFGYAAVGLLYISLSITLFVFLRYYGSLMFLFQKGAALIFPLFIIACMWINDTMAYIVGSFIGKTPFSKISPKKTWEGTIGGIILCTIVVGALTPLCFKNDIAKIHWYMLALIAAVAGTIGDLLESKLKRTAGVKDSGNIMPGHGGFLDRFDSLLLATPFVCLYVYFFFGV
jgi:phosphatidate cytidylyltransferase